MVGGKKAKVNSDNAVETKTCLYCDSYYSESRKSAAYRLNLRGCARFL